MGYMEICHVQLWIYFYKEHIDIRNIDKTCVYFCIGNRLDELYSRFQSAQTHTVVE